MNVLLVSRGYPSKNDPMWGNFEKDQAIALCESGHNVVIMSVDGRFRLMKRKIGITYLQDEAFSVYSIFYIPFAIFSLFSYGWVRKVRERMMLKLFKRVVKDHGIPDVIYVHYLMNLEGCRLIKEQYGVPIVGIEHWSEVNKTPIKAYVNELGQYGYQVPDALIAVSSSLHNCIKKQWGKDSIVIPNMVGKNFLTTTQFTSRKRTGLIEFLSVGSLIDRKGFDLLIKAFFMANIPKSEWRLRIIGGGLKRDCLQNLIDSLGLNNNIYLIGKKEKKEINDLLSESDVFVLASRHETFGVVYIEAMASGVPVIGTACGGPEEIINESNGILVLPEDIVSLSKALVEMITKARTYKSEAIAAFCRETYSPDIIVAKLNSVFEKVIKQKKK